MVKCESLRINMFRITHTGKVSKFSSNIPNCTRNHVITYTNIMASLLKTKDIKNGKEYFTIEQMIVNDEGY